MTQPFVPKSSLPLSSTAPSLASRLEDEEVSTADRVEAAITSVRDNLISEIPGVGLLTGLVKSIEDFDAKLRQKKVEALLERYLSLVDQTAEQVEQLKRFLTDPWGATLFSKLTRVLEVNPPDPQMNHHFAVALKRMVMSDFKALFSDHRFALGVIEALSPQAMAILSDYGRWPTFPQEGGFSANDGVVQGTRWIDQMSNAYGALHGLDADGSQRLGFVLQELQRMDLAAPRIADKSNREIQLTVTAKGSFILPYVREMP